MIKISTISAIQNHVCHGIPTGSFVRAVLENNLKEAFMKADDQNRADLFEIVDYCYYEIPAPCWGSPEKVKAWRDTKAKERKTLDKQEAMTI